MPFYGDTKTRQAFHCGLPSRPAPGNGQSSSPPSQPRPAPYDTAAGAQWPSSGQQQQQQTAAASPTEESPYPCDRTYLFILSNELWCYCPELVSDDEEVGLFYQASGIAAAQGMYVADEDSIVIQSSTVPAPAPAPTRVDRDLWRCNRWASGMCLYDGWTLFLGTSCYGCAVSDYLTFLVKACAPLEAVGALYPDGFHGQC